MVTAGLLATASQIAWSQADADQIDIGSTDATVFNIPEDLTIRVRVTALEPVEPTPIQWRVGGEGLGGDVIKGAMTKTDTPPPDKKIPGFGNSDPSAAKFQTFEIGEWSAPMPLAAFKAAPWPNRLFITFTVGRVPKTVSVTDRTLADYTKGVALEFEVAYQGNTIKTYTESSPDGSSVGLVIWPERWAGQEKPDYSSGVMGLLEYVILRTDYMEKLTWANAELPKRFFIATDLGGYGLGSGYGIHHGNPAIVEAEARTLRQLGVNSLRAAPSFLVDLAKNRQGIGAYFARGRIVQIGGYPVVPRPRVKSEDIEVGCPFSSKVPDLTKTAIEKSMEEMRSAGVPEVWGLTVDEIGVVFDNTNDGKVHVEKCPLCCAEFVKFLKSNGLSPEDLGQTDWVDVKPFIALLKNTDKSWMNKPGMPLAAYFTRRFLAEASASMFTPLRQSVAAANQDKAKSVKGTPVANQPTMVTYALRGNTFLLGGHSLDFFDFYRRSDNGFVYETSNRDPRVHQWDSYLCDVGRMVTAEQNLALGIYVKPHRGSVVQRTISAVGRGATMLFWYTYGPDYSKGDCFSSSLPIMELTSKVAHLIAKAERYLYGAKWAKPARIGIVKPNTTEIWMGLMSKDPIWTASWENAKWIYTALAHEHLKVDPLDEGMLENRDLSSYQVLYVHGPNLRRAAAAKLAQWVKDGGTLYTSGWSLTRDEANQPLETMLPVLGLESRGAPEMYLALKCYAGGSLDSFDAIDLKHGRLADVPEGAAFKGQKQFDAAFMPKVGREVLKPASGTEVLANFADGSVAITRHSYGKGQVFVAGFFPGLEYSAAIRNNEYDMSKQFDANLRKLVTAPALAKIQPIVDTAIPTVEGTLLINPSNGLRCVTLMNWTYRVDSMLLKKLGAAVRRTPITELVVQKDVSVTIRDAGEVTRVRSALLGRDLVFEEDGDLLKVNLPELHEADVLLLD